MRLKKKQRDMIITIIISPEVPLIELVSHC